MAIAICGCQTPMNKWTTASKDRSSSKSKSDREDRNSGPPKGGKGSERIASSERNKDAIQLADLLEKGDRYRRNAEYEEAKIAYSGALAISPENPDINHRLAIIADKQQKFSVADQHYQAALRSRPRDVNLLSDFGYSCSLRGNSQQAEQTLKQALAIDPTHRGAMANLGSIYAQQNRYQEALAMFRKGSPTEAEAQQNIAKLFPRSASDPLMASSDKERKKESSPATSSTRESADLSKLSLEQLEAEIARRDPGPKQNKKRNGAWDEEDAETEKLARLESNLRRAAATNADFDAEDSADAGKPSRSQGPDPQIQQAKGVAHADLADVIRPKAGASQTTRIATQIGMNTGPGNLFPILSLDNEKSPTLNRTGSLGTGSVGTSSASPTSAPARSALPSRTAAWRDNLQNSISWDSDMQEQEENATESPSPQARSSTSRTRTTSTRLDSNSFTSLSGTNDSSGPYKGSWPKANDLPARTSSNSTSTRRMSDNFDDVATNLGNNTEAATTSRYADGAPSQGLIKTPSQWPDAPNRN